MVKKGEWSFHSGVKDFGDSGKVLLASSLRRPGALQPTQVQLSMSRLTSTLQLNMAEVDGGLQSGFVQQKGGPGSGPVTWVYLF